MIKIFRNIRKKLLIEGKTSNYLKYAIGEIVLVVVGILIALQINNWNENTNLSKKEVALLVNLKNDIEADISGLKRQDSLYAKKEMDAALGIELFYKAKTIKDIDSVFSLTSGLWNELFINRNTYNEMINSGSMYTMKNKELQKRINKYYNLVEAHIEYIRSVNSSQGKIWEHDPALYPAKLLEKQLRHPRIDIKSIDTAWINNPKSATYLSLENALNSNQNGSNIYRREVFRRILKAGNELNTAITKELDSRR
ncbi:MAG: hypothetical protein COZ75_03215 [Flavobacteriaceae bacterium CG_4_8_14_3_um_filter_34_10]|nr:MAG: hypothetical protein COZ75_03215 [Flavobacteriaceae bacterium CG_4_8_14_3_um_filter_34_10]